MFLSDFIRRNIAGILLGLILAVLYGNHFIGKTYVEIDVQTYVKHKAPIQVFWAEDGEPFSEQRVRTHWIFHESNVLRMRVGDLSGNARLRIDPLRYQGHVKIKSVHVNKSGYKPQWFKTESSLAKLEPVKDISEAVFEEDGLVITTSGADSQLVMNMALEKIPGFQWHHVLNIGLILLASIVSMSWLIAGISTLSYVPAGLFLVLIMAMTMATVSETAVHPDEPTHLDSIKFYQKYNLPPAVDAPEMVYTYSAYGNSRLIGNEVYYPVSGFYVRLLEEFKLPTLAAARSFSLLMLTILLLCAVSSSSFRVVATPLLITPQVWYHFSYANSDMFAITVCFLIAWLCVEPKSLLNQFLISIKPKLYLLKVIVLGVVLGSLLFLKINYYVFALFVGLYYFWRLWRGDFEQPVSVLVRGGLITLVGLSLYGGKVVYDGVINDWDRSAKVHQMWEKYAHERFKPSTSLEKRHPEMYLRERGNTIGDMFTKHFWGGKTYLTSVGGYGYTQFFAVDSYYDWIKGLLLLSVLLLAGAVLIRGPMHMRVLLLITAVCVVLVIGIALTVSWIRILQPQGRYLAAILPIVGMFYFHAKTVLPERIWHSLVLSLFVMGVYSFLFIGLADIPKVGL